MKAPLLALVCALAVAATATAQAPPPLTLVAGKARPGRIDLTLTGPAGSQLDVIELSGAGRRVGHVTLDPEGRAVVRDAATWSCTQRERSFQANGTDPAGAPLQADADVTTRSCAHRYRLRVRPRTPRAGRPVTVRLIDTFNLARGRVRVCARGPARLKVCKAPRLDPAGATRLRLPRPGRWRIAARSARRELTVRRAPGRLSLLATGDSMIQIVDGFLEDRLAPKRVSVRSDARISTGLSKPFMLDWRAHARRQVARSHPDLVVMFIGANDGFPFGDVPCCGKAWRKRYAKVAGAMMRTYAQGGRATVYWCLLPAPRGGNFRRVFVAVNAALRRAAERHRGTVHLVDLPATFTPGYRFRQTIRWHGRTESVRQDDGVHLNVAGASIAAAVMVARMVRDGVL